MVKSDPRRQEKKIAFPQRLLPGLCPEVLKCADAIGIVLGTFHFVPQKQDGGSNTPDQGVTLPTLSYHSKDTPAACRR